MVVVGADTHQTLSSLSVGDTDMLEKAIGLREVNREVTGPRWAHLRVGQDRRDHRA